MNEQCYYVPKSTSIKAAYNLEDILPANHNSEIKYIEHETDLSSAAITKQSDNARLLPKYSAVLARSVDDGVNMDDLDQLQEDLEKLLSMSASKTRWLLSEIDSLEEDRDEKEINYDKTPLNRIQPEETPKYKDLKNGTRLIIKQYGPPVNNVLGQHDVSKISLPNNNSPVEPYSANDVAFLDTLIQEFSKDIEFKIPEVGDHYAHQSIMSIYPNSKSDIEKNGVSVIVDTISGCRTQVLLPTNIYTRQTNIAPVEEKLSYQHNDQAKSTDLNLKSSDQRVAVCVDKKLEQSFLSMVEPRKTSGEDGVLENKKCQKELKRSNENTLEEVNNQNKIYLLQTVNGQCSYVPKSTSSKTTYNLEEILPSNHKSVIKYIKQKTNLSNLPYIKQSDIPMQLPKYGEVLTKSVKDSVNIDDLEQLQLELKKLLSICTSRSRFLLSEIESIDRVEDRDKKEKSVHKISLKRKFWSSIEPYCTNVSKEDVDFLDALIEEFSQDIDVTIPEVGDHCSQDWSDDFFTDEEDVDSDIEKNCLTAIVNQFSRYRIQSTKLAPLEEKLSSYTNIAKLKSENFNSETNGSRVCIVRKLEEGILEEPPDSSEEDDILMEIKKCQQELKTINKYNLEELNKLKSMVESDLKKQHVKEELEKIDSQVLDLYNKLLIAKKQAQQSRRDGFDISLFTHKIAKDFEAEANAILKQQLVLHSCAYPEYNPPAMTNNDQNSVDID